MAMEKLRARHELVDDAVNGGEELLEILGGAGFFGNAIESGAESFGALALGDVAIDGNRRRRCGRRRSRERWKWKHRAGCHRGGGAGFRG